MPDYTISLEDFMAIVRKQFSYPIAFAEGSVISCLYQLNDENIIERIQEHSFNIQNDFWRKLTSGPDDNILEDISFHLHHSLHKFYQTLPLPENLPYSIVDCIKSRTVVIPEDCQIDWPELQINISYYFEGPFNEQFKWIDQVRLESWKALTYMSICSDLIWGVKSFDEEIFYKRIEGYFNYIENYSNKLQEEYWQQYDQPPLQQNINKINHEIYRLKFQKSLLSEIGIPSYINKNIIRSGLVTIDSLQELLQKKINLHFYKKRQLIAKKTIIEYESEQNTALEPPYRIYPKLNIKDEHSKRILTALEHFINQGIEVLQLVLNGKETSEIVIFKDCNANSLAEVFF